MSAVYLTRQGIHPKTGRIMARFYKMLLAPTLFGECALVREWGRIGRSGQVRSTAYPTAAEANAALNRHKHAKRQRGYNVVAL